MRNLLIAALIAATPVFAHEHADHAKGEHADAPRSFATQPAPGTWATCPVSGDVFKVGTATEFATWDGRVYAFCCPDCRPDFLQNPARYADRKKQGLGAGRRPVYTR